MIGKEGDMVVVQADLRWGGEGLGRVVGKASWKTILIHPSLLIG